MESPGPNPPDHRPLQRGCSICVPRGADSQNIRLEQLKNPLRGAVRCFILQVRQL